MRTSEDHFCCCLPGLCCAKAAATVSSTPSALAMPTA
eukprot:CAMPEP_0171805488 /NCGR_PEP_ID=MMETSP0991-20121206/74742_1 /TAXON_ID=483369 /ORGANISM="non described non described, Strain CCMP2098" /LENGTH=36 /DNA_ID=CAMNT_0012418073 /DNA_START=67 /DNA_END=173 /DNA_ORIENTATION=+